GAQYPRMAVDLHAHEPIFREHLDRGLDLLAAEHGIDLRPLLFCAPDAAEAANAELDRMPNQLPAIFLTSVAMARLFESWGVTPQALLGHSLGENTAAHLAGVMSFEDCLGLVVLRGQLFEKTAEGAMLSVDLSEAQLRPYLSDDLDLAVLNAPEATVVSGPPAAIDALAARLEGVQIEGVDAVVTKRLAIPTAAHSRLLDPILDEFGAYLRSIRLERPKIPFLCNVTGTWITDAQATSPDYWVQHLRSPVRFADDVATLLAGGNRVCVECGPGRALSSLVRAHPDVRKGTHNAFPSIRHRDEVVDDQAYFTACLGRIWASGGSFDVEKLWDGETHVRVELPTYAWSHKRFFIEPGRVQVADPGTDLPKIADVERWGWRPNWKPALTDPRPHERHTWLVFMDQAGVGRRLVTRLEARGDRVVSVYEGDAYLARSDREFSLSPERGKEGYAALVRDLVARGLTPDRVVHLWLLEAKETFRPGSSLFHHHQERGFFSLFFLAQALADEEVPTPLHVSVVLNGLMRVEDEPVAYPDKATVLGPARVIERELEGVTASVIDVELPRRSEQLFGGTLRMAIADPFGGKKRVEQALDELVDRLEEELSSPPRSATVAWRGPKRFEQIVDRTPLAPTAGLTPPLREGGVYLITGGLGGLGLTFAEWLAREAKAKLVLLSRSPIPPRDHWAAWMRQQGPEDRTSKRLRRLLDVEEAGGEVLVVSADVTNVLELREAVATAKARFGAVHGVLHTAGVIADDLIALKTQASVEDVFTPKIQGTLVLDEVFRDEPPLDFLVLFSSTSVATAPPGQVDYVAANAFLDAFAQSRVDAPTRTVSVHWGLWSEVGMAAAQMASDRVTAGTRVGEPPRHAVLNARVADGRGGTALSGVIAPETHWLLDGHRTKNGHALVPGTGFLELARAALRASGEAGPFEIEDLFFIRPLAVADDAAREIRVTLTPTQRGYAFEVRGAVELDGRRGWEIHAQAHLALRDLAKPAPLDAAALERRCSQRTLTPDPRGITTPQERHLRFGPRWRVLHAGGFGDGEAFGWLSLPDAFASEVRDYGLHPALLDIATGWAMALIEGYDGAALWVPVGYERVRVFEDLPASLVSWVRGHAGNRDDAEFVYFDVTLADAATGRVVLEVDRLALRKMAGDVDFAVRSRPSPRDVELEPTSDEAREPSPAEQQLARNLKNGILPDEGRDALARVLAGPRLPEVYVSSLDLEGLVRQAGLAQVASSGGEGIKLARPDLDSEFVEARDEVERTLVGFWQELLGVDTIGVEDSFFDLGGHSLIAVRLFAKVKKAYEVEFPISVLFEAPTVAGCADLIKARIGDAGPAPAREAAPRTRYTHLVAMHPGEGGPKAPFFLVAGMFGNVLNLRHLAHLVGTDRRFYGLQARGLYGDQAPHETFEEMAEAYIAEMRSVQPRGPYFLGGFSGGGITAYEIAQQLRASGEEVALLVFLDTPLPSPPPKLSVKDRALIQIQQLEQKGPAYVSEWAVSRWQWEMGKLRARFEDAEPDRAADEFHDEAIEAAFRRALGRYALRPWPGAVTLFRPKLSVAFDLGQGRLLDGKRDYVFEDNGWTPHVGQLDVFEVPGDHDSMVLEPNVRVLAGRLRAVIEAAENELRARSRERAQGASDLGETVSDAR
ncbi:MAG: KR domain-containing protein, partial [Myxococcales bacterium]|nr:KR domain-containing protein [Myxococcales bacterium]